MRTRRSRSPRSSPGTGLTSRLPLDELRISDEHVLVTGAAGFVGWHLCKALRSRGARVIAHVRRTAVGLDADEQHEADIADRSRMRELVLRARPFAVVHLAAAKNRTQQLDHFRTGYEYDVLGCLALAQACLEAGTVARFVSLGACEEYGRAATPFDETCREQPASAYGTAKLAVTQLLQSLHRSHGFPAVVLRPTIAYGPGQGTEMFLPALITALLAGRRFAMSGGEQTRDYVFIADVVEGIIAAMSAPCVEGRIINVSSAVPVRLAELAQTAARLIGPQAGALIDFGAQPYRPGEAMDYCAANDRARALLGWTPRIELAEGLARTVAHYRAALA